MRAVKTLSPRECENALFRVDLGTARVEKWFRNGAPRYLVTAASGRMIGAATRSFTPLFEAKLAARGSGDGLFLSPDVPISAPGGEPAGAFQHND
jgi:hypothetical protein